MINFDNIISPTIIPIPTGIYIAKLKLFKEVKSKKWEYSPKADNIEAPKDIAIIA